MTNNRSPVDKPVQRTAEQVDRALAPQRVRPGLALLLLLTLLGTYAYFWQSRDWNAASRLMLTYSLVDRHQVQIDGLERQAGVRAYDPFTRRFRMIDGDLAQVGSHFYTDKAPGSSLLGAIVYAVAKKLGGLRDHELDQSALAYWPADYWITLGTSGVSTALLAVMIYAFSLRLGATHLGGVVAGLAYGLGTPALVYATLFNGHQLSAFCTFTSFFLLYRAAHEGRANGWNILLAGLLAGYAIVVEYQTIVIGAVLGLYAILVVRRGALVTTFALAGIFAASLLAAYNYRAYGDPLDLGYAHEVSPQFSAIHSPDNPLGLKLPRWEAARDIVISLLWGPFRGMTFYAPVLIAAPLGLIALAFRKYWGVALVALSSIVWLLFVNVSYPLWQGGWCTGPRLLVPAIPFATLLVAGLLGVRRSGVFTFAVGVGALAGAALMIGCVAVGGRFPVDFFDSESRAAVPIDNPVLQIVWPHWRGASQAGDRHRDATPDGSVGSGDAMCPLCGRHPKSFLASGGQFEWSIGRWLVERYVPGEWIGAEPSPWQALQVAPLVLYLVLMTCVLVARAASERRIKTDANEQAKEPRKNNFYNLTHLKERIRRCLSHSWRAAICWGGFSLSTLGNWITHRVAKNGATAGSYRFE